MSAREYCHISQYEFEDALGMNDGEQVSGLTFIRFKQEGCRELVYDAPIDDRYSIRVYSSIVPNCGARDVGQDAIKVVRMFWYGDGNSKPIGKQKRVNRIQTWKDNLLLRIASVLSEPVIGCPACGGPMKQRSGPYGAFLGCLAYPHCTGRRKIEK
jgi:hypothetical protein